MNILQAKKNSIREQREARVLPSFTEKLAPPSVRQYKDQLALWKRYTSYTGFWSSTYQSNNYKVELKEPDAIPDLLNLEAFA